MIMPRITVTDENGVYLTTLDNRSRRSLHYSDDKLHTYLTGTAATFDFKVTKTNPDFAFLKEGCKLLFKFEERQYALTIVTIAEDEYTMSINALSLALELNNAEVDEYEAKSMMAIEQYIDVFDPQDTIKIGINELDYRRQLTWSGSETLLARLLSLAEQFDAEIEFINEVDVDYNVTGLTLNIYKKHSSDNQGIGMYRPEIKLEYGRNVEMIQRTSDIMELKTSIRPIGSNDLTLIGKNYEEYNEDGDLEYFSFNETGWIYAPLARDKFPSNTTGPNTNDRYMGATWKYDTGDKATQMINDKKTAEKAIESEKKKQKEWKEDHDKKLKELNDEYAKNVAAGDSKKAEATKKKIATENEKYAEKVAESNKEIAKQQKIIDDLTAKIKAQQDIERDQLYTAALARLKEISKPKITYDVKGYFELGLGDTVRIYDNKFDPPLILEARVSEQEISFTNPSSSKTHFTNFVELSSQIDSKLLERVQELIKASTTYDSLSAITTTIGTLSNSFTVDATTSVQTFARDLTTETIEGSQTISDEGKITTSYRAETYSGENTVDYTGYEAIQEDSMGYQQRSKVSHAGIDLSDERNNFYGRLDAEMLNYVEWQDLTLKSGFTSSADSPVQYRARKELDQSYKVDFRGWVTGNFENEVVIATLEDLSNPIMIVVPTDKSLATLSIDTQGNIKIKTNEKAALVSLDNVAFLV